MNHPAPGQQYAEILSPGTGLHTRRPVPNVHFLTPTHLQVGALEQEIFLVPHNLSLDGYLLESAGVHEVVHVALQVSILQLQPVHLGQGYRLTLHTR